VTVDKVGTDPLGLRPKPRDPVGDTAIQFDTVECDPTLPIDAVGVGEGDELRQLGGPAAAAQFCPAIKQKCPFIAMARLEDFTQHS
jgi:hypothetical protein